MRLGSGKATTYLTGSVDRLGIEKKLSTPLNRLTRNMNNRDKIRRWSLDHPDEYLKAMDAIRDQVEKLYPLSARTLLRSDTYSHSILISKLSDKGKI